MANRKSSFGANPAPLMYVAKFAEGKWQDGNIQAFGDITLSPFAMCFHYGQTIFEGLKAFRSTDDQILIFRQGDNYKRLNKSLERMAMPPLPWHFWEEGILSLVSRLEAVVPPFQEGNLYLRPFVIATQAKLGVEASNEYLFLVVASPSSSYYNEALRVKVEKHYTRAAPGGAGYAKCGGNYGGALLPFRKAMEEGFDQILWTDAHSHELFEESGTMNLGFIIDGTFITPPASDTILDGITRWSVIQLAKDLGIRVEERPFSVSELKDAFAKKQKVEAFGIGTAASIAPFKSISIDGVNYTCYHAADAQLYQLKSMLQGIQMGKITDSYGWNTAVEQAALAKAI